MLDYKIGEKVRLTKSIYDDGQDHHPPCRIAKKDEIVVIEEVREKSLAVHHEDVTDGSAFIVYEGEFCPTLLQ